MRSTRLLLIASLAAVAACVLGSGTAQARERPNVVVIMTDDQDFRSMGAMPKTRRLIARRGTTASTATRTSSSRPTTAGCSASTGSRTRCRRTAAPAA